MKRAIIGLLGVVTVVLGMSDSALSWEKGTHAYIANLIKGGWGQSSVEALYGAMAPDAFNFLLAMPGLAYRDFLYQGTHYEFQKVSDAVRFGYEKPGAMGFISHNNEWGADRTAHTHSLTLDPGKGYVIIKAEMLNAYMMNDPGYAALLGDFPGVALEICHNLVEAAGDVILKRYDPSLGSTLVELAERPRANVQNLMVRAYALDLAEFSKSTPFPIDLEQARGLIIQAESEFRLGAIGYGYLLQGDEETLVANIIDQFKGLAAAFLAIYGLPVPDDATLTALISGGLGISLQLCEADYMTEVHATAEAVLAEIKSHKH